MNNLTDIFHYGVVEQRDEDEFVLGRCKVRVIGIHTENKDELPTKDLPWAYPMGSLNSASMSGIGMSPVGPVEGTIVIVIFRDVYKQHPIMIGTLGGIPESFDGYNTTVFTSELDSNGSGSGTGSSNNNSSSSSSSSSTEGPTSNKKDTFEQKKPTVQKPGGMSASDNGKNLTKNYEGLASLSKTKTKIGTTSSNLSDDDKVYAYQDSGGVWTIGWGNTQYADGSAVKEGDVITKGEADSLFNAKHQEFANKVNNDLKVPVTQSMFDSLTDMSYNMGHAGLTKSKMWSALNQGRYEDAAALIPSTRATVKGQYSKGLSIRRDKEKTLFLKDGIPSKDLSKVDPDPTQSDDNTSNGESTDKTSDPAVRKTQSNNSSDNTTNSNSDATYADSVKNKQEDKKTDGFRDPNKKYPLEQFLNEPDTHRLARHEKINETIVAKKEAARVEDIPVSEDKKWSQPKIPYNAKYPFNQVFVSEAGHTQEFDNTKGNERIHTYHISGTFEEIDKNGTQVRRIVGDNYEILERHGYVLIKGTCNVTIQGSSFVRIENDSHIQVLGNCKTDVTGNMETSVKGDYKVKAKSIQLETYGGDFDVKVEGIYAEDAKMIYMNSGIATATGLTTPSTSATGEPEFSELVVPSRDDDYQGNYETEEEGDNTEFLKALETDGISKPPDNQPQQPSEKPEETKPEEKKKPEPTKKTLCEEDPNYPLGDGPYSSGTKLNSKWSLGDVCTGRSGIPNSSNYGLSAKQIVTNLQVLTNNVIDPVKKLYPNMIITNTFRSEAVNNSITGASKTSDHLKGCAVDIQFSGFDRKQTYEAAVAIQKALQDYDQILLEYSGKKMWVHISFKCQGMGGNRREIRTIDVFNRKNNVAGKFVLYN